MAAPARTRNPSGFEALLLMQTAELEAALAKRTFARDKARKMVNDLCD